MLGSFNKTVLIVACILLILGLVLIGLFISKNIEKAAYPPVVGDCPDYWDVGYNTSTNKKTCTSNSINIGRVQPPRCRNYAAQNFDANGTSVDDIICSKHRWAKECNIHWDGITNNSQACANTTI
jgi:hypothetical protein